jgi:hypothetical protein
MITSYDNSKKPAVISRNFPEMVEKVRKQGRLPDIKFCRRKKCYVTYCNKNGFKSVENSLVFKIKM